MKRYKPHIFNSPTHLMNSYSVLYPIEKMQSKTHSQTVSMNTSAAAHQPKHHRPIILAIEGNIGAGKTTLFDHLKTNIERTHPTNKIVFMREPVDIWQSICDATGDSILAKFYRDADKYAFPFQIMAFTTRLALLRKTIDENPDCHMIVCERSLEADKNIFAKMLFMEGRIEDVNYQIYHHLYNSSAMEYKVDAIIYVDADPDVCHNRVHTRNRDGEAGIQLDYLKRCRNYYHDWLIYGSYSGGKTKCVHVEGHDMSGCVVVHELDAVASEIEKRQQRSEVDEEEDRGELDKIVYKNILVDREHIPEVLRINANRDALYKNEAGDVGNIWVEICTDFVDRILMIYPTR